MSTDTWEEGDLAVLLHPLRDPILLRIGRGPQRVGDGGVVDLSAEVGRPVGGAFAWVGEAYHLVRPALADQLSALRRGAQIVGPKDAAALVHLTGVGPRSRVGEAGSGSGALTIVLAHAVGDRGHVTSFERRRDFLEAARANVVRSGLEGRVEFRERDVVRDGFEVEHLDALILDLPEPWEALAAGRIALAIGGYLATYSPTYNQLERTVRAFRQQGFGGVRALELLQRGLHVGEGGTRPEFEMLGHTGFLAVGRRVT